MTDRAARRKRQRRRFVVAMVGSVVAHLVVFAFLEIRGPGDRQLSPRDLRVVALDAPEPLDTRTASAADEPAPAPTAGVVSLPVGDPGYLTEATPSASIAVRASRADPRAQLPLALAEMPTVTGLPTRNSGVLFRPASDAARDSDFGRGGHDGFDVIYSGGGVDPVCKPRQRTISGVDRNANRRPPPPPEESGGS